MREMARIFDFMEAVDTTGSKTIFQSMTSEKSRSLGRNGDRVSNIEEKPTMFEDHPCRWVLW